MRLSFVFSLLVGLAALLMIAQRLPLGARMAEPATAVRTVAHSQGARAVQAEQSDRIRADRLTPKPEPKSERAVHGQFYRWRDERGAIYLQTDPPPADVNAQVIRFVRRQAVAAKGATPPATDVAPKIAELLPAPLSVYTPQGFDELLQRVEETAVMLQQRRRYVELLEKQL